MTFTREAASAEVAMRSALDDARPLVLLWHLADLLAWLVTRDGYVVDAGVLETCTAAMRVNIAKESARLAHAP